MEEWLELDIPKLGYILEFSFPQNDIMLVRTPDGMFSIDLQDEPARVDHVMSTEEVEVLDNGDSWGTEYSETLNFDDEEWFFLGSETTVELMTTISTGVRIEISNDRKHIMLINTGNEKIIQGIEFIPATEDDDFSIAGFSLDEKYLILCTNDLLRVFVRDELD